MPVKNAFTVDLEDWFHISGVETLRDVDKWDRMEPRIQRNTARLLQLLEENNVKATFFVLGWAADRYPKLVKKIYRNGHEIGNHGYSHELVYNMTHREFQDDLLRSERAIKKAIGEKVTAYRAPTFSINSGCMWAFEVLAKNGYTIDSSIFMGKRDCGGTEHPKLSKKHLFSLRTGYGEVVEFPLRKERFMGVELPVTGGGYLRTLPLWVIDRTMKKANEKGMPFYLYIHPSDVDEERPVPKDIRLNKRIRARIGLKHTERKLRHLIKKYEFAPIGDVIEGTAIMDYETI
ncbi:MAG: polysaccharide deacetylase family protein [Thermoplasmata archaeon]